MITEKKTHRTVSCLSFEQCSSTLHVIHDIQEAINIFNEKKKAISVQCIALVSNIHALLCQYINKLVKKNNLDDADIAKMVTSRWISSLATTFNNHIAFTALCKCRYAYGIYRCDAKLQPALS